MGDSIVTDWEEEAKAVAGANNESAATLLAVALMLRDCAKGKSFGRE